MREFVVRALKPYVPRAARDLRGRYIMRKFNSAMRGKSVAEIFTGIYDSRLWGVSPVPGEYSSGVGSHDSRIVEPYLASVSAYLRDMPSPPDVVDLGCGNFAVGSRLRDRANRYIACDIVADVIARNRERYASLDVDFRVLDMTKDGPPPGDVVTIRQVLQHLSNRDIGRVLERIRGQYGVLILTEGLPQATDFTPNIDIVTGPDTRLSIGSGVDITQPPFQLPVTSSEVLCEVTLRKSRIRTTAYRF